MLCAQQLLAEVTTEHLLSIKNDLDQPIDTAIASNGDIYSLNGVLSQVVVFDEKGRRKNRFGRMGKGDGGLDMPMAISISHQQVFIADTGNARISVFDLKGRFIRNIVLSGRKKKADRAAPVSMLILENAVVWSDRNNHQLCITQINTGKTRHCWGKRGDADGEFNYPYQLAGDGQGYIFAVDVLNARVQVFTSRGKHFMNVGHFAVNVKGGLFRPNGLALSEGGYLLVSDAYLGTITVFKNGKALGLLKGADKKPLKFGAPTSLTLHGTNLYVTDALNNRVEVFSLRNVLDEDGGNSHDDTPESSRKNCISCHVSWAKNYESNDDVAVAPAAQQRMCYSCHHGVVIDSRNTIMRKHQHPDVDHRRENKKTKEGGDKIAKVFPLTDAPDVKDKELYCGSCHTPHKFDGDSRDDLEKKHNNSWMRETNAEGEICLHCHESKIDDVQHKQRKKRGVNHPVGVFLKPGNNAALYAKDKNLQQGMPEKMRGAGASLNSRQQMVCQSCHKVHGSDEEKLTVIKYSDAEMCVLCHQRHNAKDLKDARKKGVHPVNIKLEKPVKINGKKIELVDCLSCHSTHNGKPGTALLSVDDKNGELCNICHTDYNKLVNTEHDLRISADKSENRYHQTPEQVGVCGSCHRIHQVQENNFSLDASEKSIYTGKEKPLPRDQACLNCHREKGIAEKSQIKFFSHPVEDMILRSDKKDMPLMNDKNEINEFGKIACITCHNPHRWSAHQNLEQAAIKKEKNKKTNSGNVLSSFLRKKKIQDSFCKDCHGIETKVKYKYYHLEASRKIPASVE